MYNQIGDMYDYFRDIDLDINCFDKLNNFQYYFTYNNFE